MSKRRQQRKPTQANIQKQEDLLKAIPSELLKTLPQNTQIAVLQSISFQGPLPPPALYREYKENLPGAEERILKLAENEQTHRHQWDNNIMRNAATAVRRGQWMGFGVACAAILFAAFCAYLERDGGMYIFGGISFIGILSAFVPSRSP